MGKKDEPILSGPGTFDREVGGMSSYVEDPDWRESCLHENSSFDSFGKILTTIREGGGGEWSARTPTLHS